jgi:hypothetical protein
VEETGQVSDSDLLAAPFGRQVRRDRLRQPEALGQNFIVVARGEAAHLGGVIILFNAGLYRFPVA